MKIILASTSLRRKELLEREGIDFIIDASSITEYFDSSLEIEERLKKLAYDKGVSIHEKYPEDVVISADTTIYHNGKIIGKAHSAHEAREILESLSSDTHSVFTSVAVFYKDQVCIFVDETKVTFKNINDMIDDYLSIDEWKGKLALMRFRVLQGKFIEEVQGDIDNVIGLPVKHVIEVIETLTKKPL
ncbi:Maf family protein [Catenibacterium sp.]|uniref:Maf family protein n=1 Tax=Catenibacterium sp. TaxID=2049022 RepID=UPI003991B85D